MGFNLISRLASDCNSNVVVVVRACDRVGPKDGVAPFHPKDLEYHPLSHVEYPENVVYAELLASFGA